jgi:hypothetical protein
MEQVEAAVGEHHALALGGVGRPARHQLREGEQLGRGKQGGIDGHGRAG